MGRIIGIDLGTTNSCVAIMEGNGVVMLGKVVKTTEKIIGDKKAVAGKK